MKGLPSSRALAIRLAVSAIVFAYALGAFAVALGPGRDSSYAGSWGVGAILAGGCFLFLVFAAVVTDLARAATRVAGLALAAAVAWLAPLWVAWDGGPAVVRAIAAVGVAFVLPLLVHLVLCYPTGRLPAGAARWLVITLYAVAATASVTLALVRDPFLDPFCFNDCSTHGVVVHAAPRLARAIIVGHEWFTLLATAAACALCLAALTRATPVVRRGSCVMLAAGTLVAVSGAWRAALLLRTPLEDPLRPEFRAAFAAGCIALAAVAAALTWNIGRDLARRHAVRAIVADLGASPAPGSLRATLARALGDPDLRIVYWLAASGHYVEPDGRPAESPAPARGRSVTTLTRNGRPLASIAHAARPEDLERELGPAVRLALENERLHAEVLAQLVNLRASRARVVATADAARRRLERDLHDGAQQRLLALTYDLRVARNTAEQGDKGEVADLLAQAAAETGATVEDLRDVARGIYPAILTQAGLGAAIAALADSAPIAVTFDDSLARRHRPEIEAAAYTVVARAVHDAAHRGARRARVIARDDERLVVCIDDDGTGPPGAYTPLVDRVGAVGGRIAVDQNALRAEIPCA